MNEECSRCGEEDCSCVETDQTTWAWTAKVWRFADYQPVMIGYLVDDSLLNLQRKLSSDYNDDWVDLLDVFGLKICSGPVKVVSQKNFQEWYLEDSQRIRAKMDDKYGKLQKISELKMERDRAVGKLQAISTITHNFRKQIEAVYDHSEIENHENYIQTMVADAWYHLSSITDQLEKEEMK